MIGAIIGDIAGSRFEFNNTRDYNFQLFHKDCSYTDDTICTVAVADAILRGISYEDSLTEWCRKYPHPMGGYGGKFAQWVKLNPGCRKAYDSFGNGAAMRVSPVAWAFNDSSEVMRNAMASAECTHNHQEGIIGAIATAELIFVYRESPMAGEFVNLIGGLYYGRDWENNLPRPGVFDETCQGCVPLAFHIIKQSSSFEDAIRKAVSYGGDSDTLAAIVGSIAEARWEIPIEMQKQAMNMLPRDMLKVVINFNQRFR
ncbi:ADP-ribosylglycohydrolase family protein [Muribaculum intestinale]|uniref:ADP-ribosylglycohydrolase n=1 Tax=Muribaculum intestinale TaxID=1796646 RepID=A0A4V3RUA7_9BACT|nr:ADP-ribosylglycohydrolase family protein [Muribaculum intestinale]MYM12390.1 ADP-ribosylglycohydrolase [Muribaculum intestinale]TGY74179.1 ADP-ribosylglycohydrolase [Muribaculum intestinale]